MMTEKKEDNEKNEEKRKEQGQEEQDLEIFIKEEDKDARYKDR